MVQNQKKRTKYHHNHWRDCKMYLSQLDTTLKCFVTSHRDNLVNRRFATMITGGSGVGKTSIVKKIGTELDMAVVITHVAQLEPGELLGIPRSIEVKKGLFIQRYDLPGYLPHYLLDENGEIVSKEFDDGITRKCIDVRLLGSKVKNKKELMKKYGEKWYEHVKGVIIFLDEINRAVGDDTKQAIFELPGDYALHEYEVPESCMIIAAANPSTNDYQVNEMDQEKAWMDRFIHLTAEGRVEDSLRYFKENEFEESIISFIMADEEALMEKEKPFTPNVKRTPRSYEILDNVLKYVKLPDNDTIKREVFTGILGMEYGNNFTKHLKEKLDYIPTVNEMITQYDDVRSVVQSAINENKISFVNQIVRQLQNFFSTEKEVLDMMWTENEHGESIPNAVYIQNVVLFLEDLPSEIRMSFVKKIVEHDWTNMLLGPEDIVFETLMEDQEDAYRDDWSYEKTE